MKIRIWILILFAAVGLGYLLAQKIIPTFINPTAASTLPAAANNDESFALVPVEELSSASGLDLQDWGPAPELENEVWLNSENPLRLSDLRGKVVLLEMWTYGCYNCRNVIPALKDWHARYAADGLVIIGNHYPEFSYEKELDHLKQAVSDLGIDYAVAQDNDGKTWSAYHNRYWPTMFLIDKRGHIRYVHIGEGSYSETEAAIQTLMAESLH